MGKDLREHPCHVGPRETRNSNERRMAVHHLSMHNRAVKQFRYDYVTIHDMASNLTSSLGCNQTIFTCAVRVILRLSALPMSSSPQIERLINLSIKHLAALESTLEVPHSADGPYGHAPEVWSPAPHRSYALWKVREGDELVLWGQCVEALWSATMKIGEGSTTWDALTTRLLIWRAYAGQKSIVGEWARREVIRNMRAD